MVIPWKEIHKKYAVARSFLIGQKYLFLAFQVTKRVAYLFFCRFSKPENSQKNPGYLRPTLNSLHQVTPS